MPRRFVIIPKRRVLSKPSVIAHTIGDAISVSKETESTEPCVDFCPLWSELLPEVPGVGGVRNGVVISMGRGANAAFETMCNASGLRFRRRHPNLQRPAPFRDIEKGSVDTFYQIMGGDGARVAVFRSGVEVVLFSWPFYEGAVPFFS